MTARALAIGSKCQSCRYGVLQSFAAIAGVSIRAPTAPRSSSIGRVNRRPFTSTSKRATEHLTSLVDFKVLEDEPPREIHKAPKQKAPETEENFVPWYLQEEAPKRAPAHPLGDRQRIPDLPDDPPPILKGLLQHISVDIGLDDLTLLDLRYLDPPPALGSNLLMIIGTARSVKHLNVSGDRLCRWLRSEHKLRPYADGLLGRNELKLKLRRKARRAKLLSSVGSSMGEGADDGITTGWVCVNIGEIGSEPEAAVEQEEDDFIGFGRSSGGVKIVVQMLTEEKRTELDLESLWGGLSESEGDAEAGRNPSYEDGGAPESVPQVADTPYAPMAESGPVSQSIPMRNRNRFHQRRNYHTTQRGNNVDNIEEIVEYEGLDESTLEPQLTVEKGNENIHNEVLDPSGLKPGTQTVLQSLLAYLGDRSRTTAITQLGNGHQDRDSTEWLKKFYSSSKDLPEEKREDRLLDLYCLGVRFAHPGYPKDHLLAFFQELRLSRTAMSKTAYLNVIFALLAPIPDDLPNGDNGKLLPRVSMDNVEDAMGILNGMRARGLTTGIAKDFGSRGLTSATEKVFLMLHELIASQLFTDPWSQPAGESSSQGDSQAMIPAEGNSAPTGDSTMNHLEIYKAHDRVHDVMDALGVEWSTDESRMRILQLHADMNHWDAFWRVWGQISICFSPRSSELYGFMFRNVARSGDQRRCIDTLITYVPMMECENPPVKLKGEVAEGVLDCLMVVDPEIERERQLGGNGGGKWGRLWNQAMEGFRGSRPRIPPEPRSREYDERQREQEDVRRREIEDELWTEG